MDEAAIADPEGALLNFIGELGELEWRKYQRRAVVKLIDGESRIEGQSDQPPFVSFRFKDENESTIQRLRAAVANFEGNTRWGLFGHEREGQAGVNWTICPEVAGMARDIAKSHGCSVGDYIAEVQPTLAGLAYEDLAGLESALRVEFGK